MRRRTFLIALACAAVLPARRSEAAQPATLYKNPQCDCCEGHADYLRRNGHNVNVVPTHDLDQLRQRHGVPENLTGCHMILVGGYVVEGHVPAGTLDRLLRERPGIRGISLPGMPQGSPGMTGRKEAPFTIYEIPSTPNAKPRVYAVE